MTKTRVLLAITQVLFVAVGCQQSGNVGQRGVAKVSCSAQHKTTVDADGLKIEGNAGAKPGEPVTYQLNEDLSCSSNQEVSWKAVAGGSITSASGTTFVSAFKKPGEYVVTAQVYDSATSSQIQVATKTIVAKGLAISGPEIGMAELEHHFEIVVPAGITLTSANWNFGDGSPATRGLQPQDHTFFKAGDYTVTVRVIASNGDDAVLTHSIHVLPPMDGMECVRDLATSGPTEAVAGQPVTMSVYIPQCLTFRVGGVRWNFGDSMTAGTNQTEKHTYAQPGTYRVTLTILNRENTVMFLLMREITVTPAGTGEPETPGEEVPADPLRCSTEGATRESTGDIFTEEAKCGTNGTKTMSYRNHITEKCTMSGEFMRWTESSRVKELVGEGECKGQACELPPEALTGVDQAAMGIVMIGGKYYLPDGITKTFYSSQTPNGACSSVAETRTCSNGVLNGSTSNVYLLCNNGCPGIGPHGSSITVVTGEVTQPKTCQFGETGIVDIFNQLATRTCENGEVSTSNVRTGDLKTPGVCPTYSWVGGETWSACSADCGGTQTRSFECRNTAGEVAPAERCAGAQPVETRLCDGNPEAVRRSESSTSIEEAGSSVTCPANQLGSIIQKREVTVTKTYACINHQVGLEGETTVNGPWVEERYCRDLVAHRCEHDSLDNGQANARFQWLLKCRAQVPAIDEFLQAFEKYEKMTIYKMENLILNGRIVYPTFMDRAYSPERPWIAPKNPSGSCNVPSTVYIAAVCLASCATPEQMILAQDHASGKLSYVRFDQAWNEKFQFVATLQSQSTMSSKRVIKTAVDQFVTELVDSKHEILEFTMKSGGVLRLTPNHPLVTTEGTMQLAGEFQVGDSLVKLGGERDPIVSINKIDYFGKVYNVFVKSNELHKNIVVTNGYLNGTAYFQNDGAQHLNRRLLRGALIRGVLD